MSYTGAGKRASTLRRISSPAIISSLARRKAQGEVANPPAPSSTSSLTGEPSNSTTLPKKRRDEVPLKLSPSDAVGLAKSAAPSVSSVSSPSRQSEAVPLASSGTFAFASPPTSETGQRRASLPPQATWASPPRQRKRKLDEELSQDGEQQGRKKRVSVDLRTNHILPLRDEIAHPQNRLDDDPVSFRSRRRTIARAAKLQPTVQQPQDKEDGEEASQPLLHDDLQEEKHQGEEQGGEEAGLHGELAEGKQPSLDLDLLHLLDELPLEASNGLHDPDLLFPTDEEKLELVLHQLFDKHGYLEVMHMSPEEAQANVIFLAFANEDELATPHHLHPLEPALEDQGNQNLKTRHHSDDDEQQEMFSFNEEEAATFYFNSEDGHPLQLQPEEVESHEGGDAGRPQQEEEHQHEEDDSYLVYLDLDH